MQQLHRGSVRLGEEDHSCPFVALFELFGPTEGESLRMLATGTKGACLAEGDVPSLTKKHKNGKNKQASSPTILCSLRMREGESIGLDG